MNNDNWRYHESNRLWLSAAKLFNRHRERTYARVTAVPKGSYSLVTEYGECSAKLKSRVYFQQQVTMKVWESQKSKVARRINDKH